MNTKELKLFTLEYINLQENLSNSDKIDLFHFVSEASKEQVLSLLFTGKTKQLTENESKFVNEMYQCTFLYEFSFGSLMADLSNAIDKGIKTLPKTQAIANTHMSHFTQPLGNSELLRDLAKKWALYKVPNVDQLPGDLGVSGNKEDIAAFTRNYEEAIKSLNVGVPVAAGVVAAIIFVIARRAYKAYLTPAARACKGKTGSDKTECIRSYKMKAMKETIKVLKNQAKVCKAAKKPEKCVALVRQRINKKENELRKILMVKNPR